MWNKFLSKGYVTLFFSKLATKQTSESQPSQGREPTNRETPLSDVSIGVRYFKQPKILMDVSSHNVKF